MNKIMLLGLLALVLLTGALSHEVGLWTYEMDEMHEQVTANLEPELKEQLDIMHEGCMGET